MVLIAGKSDIILVKMGQFYVYIVKCARDNSFYTGYTNNLERRIDQHNRGIGSKYTRSHGPVELLYYENYRTRRRAMQREREIKRFTRKRKKNLINQESRKESFQDVSVI